MEKVMNRIKRLSRTEIIGVLIVVLLIGLGIKLMPIGIPFAIVGIVITGLLCFTGKDTV